MEAVAFVVNGLTRLFSYTPHSTCSSQHNSSVCREEKIPFARCATALAGLGQMNGCVPALPIASQNNGKASFIPGYHTLRLPGCSRQLGMCKRRVSAFSIAYFFYSGDKLFFLALWRNGDGRNRDGSLSQWYRLVCLGVAPIHCQTLPGYFIR